MTSKFVLPSLPIDAKGIESGRNELRSYPPQFWWKTRKNALDIHMLKTQAHITCYNIYLSLLPRSTSIADSKVEQKGADNSANGGVKKKKWYLCSYETNDLIFSVSSSLVLWSNLQYIFYIHHPFVSDTSPLQAGYCRRWQAVVYPEISFIALLRLVNVHLSIFIL